MATAKDTAKDIDLFDEENTGAIGAFFSFKEVGEKIAGILVSLSHRDETPAPDGTMYRAQTLYEINTEGYEHLCDVRADEEDKIGGIVTVGITDSKTSVLTFLSGARKGDLIGFNFLETRTAKTKDRSDTHVIVPSMKKASKLAKAK